MSIPSHSYVQTELWKQSYTLYMHADCRLCSAIHFAISLKKEGILQLESVGTLHSAKFMLKSESK